MIRIHHTQHLHDVPLIAATFSGGPALPPIIRLIPEPLIKAETLALETFKIHETARTSVGYTPKRAVGFPAWAILTDPSNAQHALNLVADVEWAHRKAKTEAGAVKKRIDELTATLQNSTPHFLPTFLEEIARIFVLVGNSVYAKQYFTKARDVERVHALPIDNERHAQVFAEYATLGAISAKAFSQEARDAAARMTAQDAYDYFFGLVIDQAKTGAGVYANAVKDLHTLGKKIGKSLHDVEQEFVAAYLPTRSFAKTPDSLLSTILARLPQILSARPELGDALYVAIHEKWMLGDYVDALVTLNLWEPLCADPEKFVPWLESTVSHGNRVYGFFRRTDSRVLDAIERNSDALQGLVLKTRTRQYHLDYLDALIGAGVGWSSIPYPHEWQMMPTFDGWIEEHHRDLKHILAHADTRAYLMQHLHFPDLAKNWDVLVSSEAVRGMIREKLDDLREQRKAATGSKAAWKSLDWSRQHITDPRVREISSRIVDEILHIDPAEELAERLRRGTIVEYTWPTFEKGAKTFATKSAPAVAAFPYVAAHKGTKLRLFDGDTMHTFTVPRIEELECAILHNDDVLIVYREPTNYELMWMWLSKGTPHLAPNANAYTQSCDYPHIIEDSCYIGGADISTGHLEHLGGVHLGFGPTYVTGEKQGQKFTILPNGETMLAADFHARFAQGDLPGLDIPAAAALTSQHGVQLSLTTSFTTWATDTTAQSPFGVDGGKLYGLVFRTDSGSTHYVSPLGTFQFSDKNMQFAVAKPGGGVWFVGHSLDLGHVLYHPATEAEIAHSLTHTGAEHVLNFIPPAGLHQLKVRNQKASAAMRACTTAQAAELISNPERILSFADGDQTLAAAIAGMIAEIGEIFHVQLPLPALKTVPEYLTHLYQILGDHILLPPAVDPDNPKQYFAEKMVRLAQVLADPRDSGDVDLSFGIDMITETIGKEKVWLAQLTTPGLPIEWVRNFHAFLTWCADHHVLGTWHRVSVPTVFHTSEWNNKVLVLDTYGGHALLWNPALSTRPELPEHQVHLNDDLFVPADEFTAALDEILNWHEKRHAAGTTNTPAWSHTTIAEAASRASSVSTLPPRVWAALFAGTHFRPFQQDFLIATDNVARALGVSPKDVAKLRGCVDGNFDSLHDSVLGLSWHENYLSTGPSIRALDDAWTRLWGKPWVHLTDDMWDEIPPELFRRVGAAFHGLIGTHDEHRSWKMDQVLPVYLHLAQLLDPGSQAAVNLAQRITDLRTCKADEHHYPCVSAVHDGELDPLISYLKAGTPVVGIKQDPLVSAPETVADVAQTLRLSENAARYFLQLLALTRPMDKNIKAWNGWAKKQLDQAREELLENELVVAAKRAGTGRNVFLPGGWLDKSDTGPAMEMWKAPHYLLRDDTQCRPIVDTCPPILPYPNLFAEVWERYKSGDVPGYEKLTTKRYRGKK